eukprot:359416-Chlamydomonas_euryale.AAC.17
MQMCTFEPEYTRQLHNSTCHTRHTAHPIPSQEAHVSCLNPWQKVYLGESHESTCLVKRKGCTCFYPAVHVFTRPRRCSGTASCVCAKWTLTPLLALASVGSGALLAGVAAASATTCSPWASAKGEEATSGFGSSCWGGGGGAGAGEVAAEVAALAAPRPRAPISSHEMCGASSGCQASGCSSGGVPAPPAPGDPGPSNANAGL